LDNSLFIGGSPDGPQHLLLKRANRHGLVAGATGTGKTITLQNLAQAFSDAGVPVFAADIKGDLSGISQPGSDSHKAHDALQKRAADIGLADYRYEGAPTLFWDLMGENGHPIRTTIAEVGPMLLARLLHLNETQEGVLTIAFTLADEEGLSLLDLKDLRALLVHVNDNRAEISTRYGNVSPASIGAIQRQLLILERDGANKFFGEPALRLEDLMRTTRDGRGMVNLLAADNLMMRPRLYATFLLWLMSELFEELPEVGDPDKPKLVLFFDEAHLLFDDAPKVLVQRIEQVVKLIRSKGVGLYFVTQNPRDVPDEVLAQLGTRVQHALRAYTPLERKAVKAAADSFRPNPAFDTETLITELGVGEALVSTLDEKGRPTMVARTLIRPPASHMGPASAAARATLMKESPVGAQYDKPIDRESAYELLEARKAKAAEALAKTQRAAEREAAEAERKKAATKTPAKPTRTSRQGYGETAAKSMLRTASNQIVRHVIRGILGGMKR
jgi:uncharacterized protein